MKIRLGFVSNSSTSSFILVGCSTRGIDIPEEEAEKFYNGEYEDVEYDSANGFIGIDIFSWDDSGGTEEISLEELVKTKEKLETKIKKVFEKMGKEVPPIKVFAGVRSC
jgi:hypothetical protein